MFDKHMFIMCLQYIPSNFGLVYGDKDGYDQ